MKKLTVFFILLALLIFTGITNAQDDQNMDDMQKIWMEYMTPGEMHKMMAKHTGEWKTTTKMWMDPSADPIVMEGTAENEMILGGRYLQSTHTGTMMGQPFHGISIEGYDNDKKVFTSVWIDNMGTGTAVSKGTYDPESKTISYKGNMYDPISKQDVTVYENVKLLDEDHQVIEMYSDMGGQKVKTMEIELKRVK